MAISNKSTQKPSCFNKPEELKAASLARELIIHCKAHNFPPDTEIYGVAINATYVKEKAYIDGKNFENSRIASILTKEEN